MLTGRVLSSVSKVLVTPGYELLSKVSYQEKYSMTRIMVNLEVLSQFQKIIALLTELLLYPYLPKLLSGLEHSTGSEMVYIFHIQFALFCHRIA